MYMNLNLSLFAHFIYFCIKQSLYTEKFKLISVAGTQIHNINTVVNSELNNHRWHFMVAIQLCVRIELNFEV